MCWIFTTQPGWSGTPSKPGSYYWRTSLLQASGMSDETMARRFEPSHRAEAGQRKGSQIWRAFSWWKMMTRSGLRLKSYWCALGMRYQKLLADGEFVIYISSSASIWLLLIW